LVIEAVIILCRSGLVDATIYPAKKRLHISRSRISLTIEHDKRNPPRDENRGHEGWEPAPGSKQLQWNPDNEE
jgi:hypothetical protein